jgi:hypothetical protein
VRTELASVIAAILALASPSASSAQAVLPTTEGQPGIDPRFSLAKHAIDRITATVLPRAGESQPANDDRISQVVETVRAIVSDTIAADARSADAMHEFCSATLGIVKASQPVATTAAGTNDRRGELAYACTDYMLARIKLAKLAVQDQGQARALKQLERTLRRRRVR